jgi:cell division protein FtsI/penicillin-binding protein 2
VTQPSTGAWRTVVSKRLYVCAVVLAVWSVAILGRLLYLQVLQHEDFARRAEKQQQRTVEAPAKRADIVDRNGQLLAYSVEADTIYAVPTDIGDPIQASAARWTTARRRIAPRWPTASGGARRSSTFGVRCPPSRSGAWPSWSSAASGS